jgi:protein-disulfide isomerase
MKQKTLFVGSAVALLLVFVVAALVYNQRSGDGAAAKRNEAVLVRPHSPSVGNPEAKVHIVEFLDPACETCASFYPFVKDLMAANPGKIKLSVRYAPFHAGSDAVVKALEAARKQDKFWEALSALLSSQREWAPNHTARIDLAWKPLARAGVDVEQAKNDMQAADIERAVRQDVEDAKTLNVTQTPEFFVNGRPMPSFGYDQLRKLVRDALAASYP